jgi:hypothetical protein
MRRRAEGKRRGKQRDQHQRARDEADRSSTPVEQFL